MTDLEHAMLHRILYNGEQIPTALTEDYRTKFVLLGTPQELIDTVSEHDAQVRRDTLDEAAAMLEAVRDGADHYEHCSLTLAAGMLRDKATG